jgi:hypothetical protein
MTRGNMTNGKEVYHADIGPQPEVAELNRREQRQQKGEAELPLLYFPRLKTEPPRASCSGQTA